MRTQGEGSACRLRTGALEGTDPADTLELPQHPEPSAARATARGAADRQPGDVHVQGLLGLGGFLLGAVADHGVALSQVQVECDERPMLQTQRPQGRAVDLMEEGKGAVTSFLGLLPHILQRKCL